MASLWLVSPAAATDGVTLFFLEKTTDGIVFFVFSHRYLESDDLFSCRLLTTPIFHVVYPVLFPSSATKN